MKKEQMSTVAHQDLHLLAAHVVHTRSVLKSKSQSPHTPCFSDHHGTVARKHPAEGFASWPCFHRVRPQPYALELGRNPLGC